MIFLTQVSRGYSLPSDTRYDVGMRVVAMALIVLVTAVMPALNQTGTRSVHGTVTDEKGSPLGRVPVLIKNLRTLRIRSFFTDSAGQYYFHALNTDIDYELQAKDGKHVSSRKTLSKFDSRKDAVIDLKIDSDN